MELRVLEDLRDAVSQMREERDQAREKMPAMVTTLAKRVAELTEQRDELAECLRIILDEDAFKDQAIAEARAVISKVTGDSNA